MNGLWGVEVGLDVKRRSSIFQRSLAQAFILTYEFSISLSKV